MSQKLKVGDTVLVLSAFSDAMPKISEHYALNNALIGHKGKIVANNESLGFLIEFESNINGALHQGNSQEYLQFAKPNRCLYIKSRYLELVTPKRLTVSDIVTEDMLPPSIVAGSTVRVSKSFINNPVNVEFNKELIGRKGIVIDHCQYGWLVEFKKDYNGFQHNGHGLCKIPGKVKSCWFISENHLTLVPEKSFKLGDRVIVKPKYVCMRYTEGYDPIIIGLTGVVILEGDTYYNVRIGDIAYRIHKKFLRLVK